MTTNKTNTMLILSIVAILTLSTVVLTSSTPTAMAQTTGQDASTGNTTGSGLPCNTSAPTGTAPFLTIDGITGTNGSLCTFAIKDFSFGVENPTTIGSATGGAGAGKINFNEFTIKKTVDSASPLIFKNAATGAHYKTVTLTMRKAGGDPQSSGQVFLKYTFGTVFTTKINWSGPGDEGPEEQVTFVYGALAVEYKTQKHDGTLGTPITNCFDTIRNTIC